MVCESSHSFISIISRFLRHLIFAKSFLSKERAIYPNGNFMLLNVLICFPNSVQILLNFIINPEGIRFLFDFMRFLACQVNLHDSSSISLHHSLHVFLFREFHIGNTITHLFCITA